MCLNKSVFWNSALIFLLLTACSTPKKESATLLFYGGPIYTVDSTQATVEAVATKDNKILFAGSLSEARAFENEATQVIDLEGKTMTPGLIEGHGHFMGLGYNNLNLDLAHTTSYQEIIDAVTESVKNAAPGEWIIGRGWHQSKWTEMPEDIVKGFQTHYRLSEISPDNPVYLSHASGHAGFVNAKAMDIAGFELLPKDGIDKLEIEGGEVMRDGLGRPTGIFTEEAISLIGKYIPESTPEKMPKLLNWRLPLAIKMVLLAFMMPVLVERPLRFTTK